MRKAKAKHKASASKLKSKSRLRSKSHTLRKSISKGQKTKISNSKPKSSSSGKNKIVRIMGQGQFAVDGKTLKKLNDIDNAIVDLVSQERSDDFEFKKRLTELNSMVMKNGKPLDPREIIKSDIILPSTDLSIDEAKRLFRGEGVIPEI